jgi:hypothetical protein
MKDFDYIKMHGTTMKRINRQVSLPCEKRYEKSVGHIRRPSLDIKTT